MNNPTPTDLMNGDGIGIADATPDLPVPAIAIDFEVESARVLAETKKRDAINCYNAHCPQSYRDYRPDHPQAIRNSLSVHKVLQWALNPRGLLLAGPTGMTKTRCAWELVRRLAYDQGVLTRAYHAQDFFSALAGEVKYGRDDAAVWIDRKAWHPVVFIDDWGQESMLAKNEDWAQAWWLRFVDLRVERGLPLIITTNLTAADARQNQSESIRADPLLRRLLEICEVVKFQ